MYYHAMCFGLPHAAKDMARPAGLEPAAYCLEGSCSIQLSYGRSKILKDTSENSQSNSLDARHVIAALSIHRINDVSQRKQRLVHVFQN